jgi:hypothetical protein
LFKGRHRAEYAWFSISDSLPGLSMSAERAARHIVAALRSGEASRVLSVPAKVAVPLHCLFPGVIGNLLAVVNRWLPDGGRLPARRPRKGEASTSELSPSWWTTLGEHAARRNNQTG